MDFSFTPPMGKHQDRATNLAVIAKSLRYVLSVSSDTSEVNIENRRSDHPRNTRRRHGM